MECVARGVQQATEYESYEVKGADYTPPEVTRPPGVDEK
eukprot:COSAG05_NODE_1587_length_4482_cov_1520.858544_2_plen_39_part_00